MKTNIWAAAIVVAVSAATLTVGGIVRSQEEEPAAEKPAVVFNDTEENTITKEIWGMWTMDEELTKHTAHEVPKDGIGEFEFKQDDGAKARIQKALEDTLKKMGNAEGENADFVRRAAAGVYSTGRVIVKRGDRTMEADFAQVSMWGEPLLMILEQEGGSEEYDWESVRISFVRDPEGDNDLLFLGGDHKDEPYVAMKRKKE